MKTKDLVLLSDWILTSSFYIQWYSNDQMWLRGEMKNGRWYGVGKGWRRDGTFWSY